MITNNEITAVELSPTKRDFYQIWNELIDTASKLSNRWDPSSTNESDPGIVLLKVLTAIADKLNYTIDKNILEAFMPSATQEESMRKLCDMLGYNMKYYRSATCSVKISYVGTDYDLDSGDYAIEIPKFTNLKNQDQDINYVTLSQVTLGQSKTSDEVDALEGEYVEYENITRDQLDDNHRYYLPEVQIAENGIFLYTADTTETEYEKVTNLNTQKLGTYCWKFGYDSKENIPYIEFPEDIDALIGEGIKFSYIRTNGANGNIAATLLNTIDSSSCSLIENGETVDCEDSWFSISNTSAATNGSDKESIDEAYNAYKKTIGTFDTLVSCRDYMNKIYELTKMDVGDSASTTPLVSNIIVSDIRDDINRGATVCSFSENGITYNNQAQDSKDINNFEILLYPFKTVTGIGSKSEYKNSFKYTNENLSEIKAGIAKNKTISHVITSPDNEELACIKDFIKVKAKITTTEKVNTIAEKSILSKVFSALYKNFNMRKVDFGEEITDEMIEKIIINADSRIKNVQLSTDHSLAFEQVNGSTITASSNAETYQNTFLNLALLNVLAGRIPLFKYDESFEPSLDESKNDNYDVYYPESIGEEGEQSARKCVTRIKTSYEPPLSSLPIKIDDNEVIQFSAPSFKTITTYPSYVNYFFHLDSNSTANGTPATFESLYTHFFNNQDELLEFVNNTDENKKAVLTTIDLNIDYAEAATSYCWIFKENEDGTFKLIDNASFVKGARYYILRLNVTNFDNFTKVLNYIKSKTWYINASEETVTYKNLYKAANPDASLSPGYLIDANYIKYTAVTSLPSMSIKNGRSSICAGWDNLYLPVATSRSNAIVEEKNGLGKDAVLDYLSANAEYQLKNNDYLLINYTSSSTDDSGSESSTIVNKIYKEGTIIRPSFNLSDSNTVHTQKSTSWSKKNGFVFNDSNIPNPEGMFTLASNEQIEIIDFAKVSLGPTDSSTQRTTVNVYWVRNDDEENTKNGVLTFQWDDDDNLSYTLKENEYFFYTNKNKTELAYYGNGTKIIRSNEDLVLQRAITQDESTTSDEILQNGLAASIPWITKTLTGENYIELQEYQYINLIKGNILTDLSLLENNKAKIDNIPTSVSSAAYKLDENQEEATELPQMILTNSTGWKVRSFLQLNMGPKRVQTLHTNDSITIQNTDKIQMVDGVAVFEDNIKDTDWTDMETFNNVSLKSNLLIQSSSSDIKIMPYNYLQVKAFDVHELTYTDKDNNVLQLDFGNYGDGITSMKLVAGKTVDIYTCIPDNHFGLIMFHVSKITEMPTVKLTADQGTLEFYNNDTTFAGTLNLGINIIKVPAECKKLTITGENYDSAFIFSNLDIIDKGNPLNTKLTELVTEAKDSEGNWKLLSMLKKYPNFYYNAVLDASNVIKFNDSDESDDLANTDSWYDYNNVCNKFFIAELDADYFDTGIIIDKGSKIK